MSTEIGWASLGVAPDLTGFGRKLDQGTSKAMLAAGASGGAKFGDAAGTSAATKFRSRMVSAAKVAAVGLAGAGIAAFKFAGDSVEEAREAQKVGRQTDAVIKSTGKAAHVTAKDVGRLSGRLSEMAGVDDELIQSGANVLLTFTKVRNEAGKHNKVFDDATLATLNMSAALKTDMSSAAIQVGKALNDPIKGVTALGRAGVQFTEDQKAQITRLVETGDQLKAQKIILKELDTQFAGSARSQATNGEKLSVAYGNLKEEVGTELLPVLDDLSGFLRKKGIPAARDFFGWVKDEGVPGVKDLVDKLRPAVRGVKDLVGFFNDLPDAAKLAPITGMLGAAGLVKLRGGKGALGAAGSALGITKPIPVLVTNKGFAGAGGGSTPGAMVGPDGKPSKTRGSRLKGKGNSLGAVIASISLPWILDEIGAEVDFASNRVKQGTFHPSKAPLPNDKQTGAGDALAGLLLDPLGTKKIKDSHDAVKRLGGEWVATGERVKDSTRKMVFGFGNADTAAAKLPHDVDRAKNSTKALQDVLAQHPRRVDTRLTVSGAAKARSDVQSVADALANVAAAASSGLDAAADTVLGRGRNRRRNIGGFD